MKRMILMVLVLVLCVGVFAGCRRSNQESTETNAVTTQTTPTTKPGMDDMLPGKEDQIDPTNGANKPNTTEPDMMEPDVTDPAESIMPDETVPGDTNTRVRPRGRLLPGR